MHCVETCPPISPSLHFLAVEDLIGHLKAQTLDEEVRQQKEEQGIESVPEWDKYLNTTEEEKDGEEVGKSSDRKRRKNKHANTSRALGTTDFIPKGEIEKIISTPSCSAHLLAMEPAGVSNHHCLISQPASPVTAHTFPHLLHLTAEDIAAAPGIDAETLPEISFTESLPVSHRSHIPVRSSPRPEVKLRASPQPAAMFSEEVMSSHYRGVSNGPIKTSDKPPKQPTPSPRKVRQHSPEATCTRTHSLSTVRAESVRSKHQTTSPDREPRTHRDGSNAAEVDVTR